MRREELTERFEHFEAAEPVDSWSWRGWRPWPALRTQLALTLHRSTPPAAAPRAAARLRRAVRARWRRARRYALQLGSRPGSRADLVFLTRSDRDQRLGDAWYNTVVDPAVEALAGAGGVTSVWEAGEPRRGRRADHLPIQHALDRAPGTARLLADAAPAWYGALADFAARALGVELSWDELHAQLARIDAQARVFTPWLERAAPRALVLDCWYLTECLAASLAAQRLGIPSIDLQHGVQGAGHFAYAGWRRRPDAGYEVFPNAFWVWGDWDAESLLKHNPGVVEAQQVRRVGNLWLASWLGAADARHAEAIAQARGLLCGERAVLVTLQKDVAFEETLLPLMRAAPAQWRWLLRLHRGMSESPREIEARLGAASGRCVEAVSATRLPLYALMRAASAHVTGFSTCALEALAFGLPTLLTHPSGGVAYAEFVRQGVMRLGGATAEDVDWLARDAGGELSQACRAASRRVFSEAAEPGVWPLA